MLYFNTGAQIAFMLSESEGRHAVLQTARNVLPWSKSGIEPPYEVVVFYKGAARA
jgi:hypothetical protein